MRRTVKEKKSIKLYIKNQNALYVLPQVLFPRNIHFQLLQDQHSLEAWVRATRNKWQEEHSGFLHLSIYFNRSCNLIGLNQKLVDGSAVNIGCLSIGLRFDS